MLNRIIIVKLQGGLGNQLFQFALGLAVADKHKIRLCLDDSFFSEVHGLTPRKYELNHIAAQVNIASAREKSKFFYPGLFQKILKRINVQQYPTYREDSLRFNRQVFTVKPPAYFDGFWQSEKYFCAIEDQIRSAFIFKTPLNKRSENLATELKEQSRSISVHVRRGDYIKHTATNELHGVCSVKYYKNAIGLIKERLPDARFYIFSDDPEWVRENLVPLSANLTLIDHNKDQDSWQDMLLMSKCRHHIIANSSFSWWGAWLNPFKEKIVIAPEKWFNKESYFFNAADIVPANWIKLSDE